MKSSLLLAVCLSSVGSLPVSAETVSNVKFPITLNVFVPCAAGGIGEMVALTGDLHEVIAITIDANGGLHMKVHDQPQGISGQGATTGAKYQATGVTQSQFNVGSPGYPFEETFINRFHIVGQGPGNDFYVQETAHITVNANGTATASFDKFSVTCK